MGNKVWITPKRTLPAAGTFELSPHWTNPWIVINISFTNSTKRAFHVEQS